MKFAKETGVTTYGKQTGTSFAAPWLCGMACWSMTFIDKTGKPLTHEAMMRFFRDHCVWILERRLRQQNRTRAWFILPEPSEINVWKYQTKEGVRRCTRTKIRFPNGQRKMLSIVTVRHYGRGCRRESSGRRILLRAKSWPAHWRVFTRAFNERGDGVQPPHLPMELIQRILGAAFSGGGLRYWVWPSCCESGQDGIRRGRTRLQLRF